MSTTWIVVAESSRARIFQTSSHRAAPEEIEGFTRPEARLKEHELVSDSPGRSFDSRGGGRHAMGKELEHKQQESAIFARDLATHLHNALARNKFSKLILIAPPDFLGLLRKALDDSCTKSIVATINKNLAQHDAADIQQHLPEWY